MDGKECVEQYRDQGYFIVDDAVEPELLDLLELAAWRVADNVRSGAVVDDAEGVRTGGEGVEPQFVVGLIAPEFGEPVFAEYLGSDALARYLRPMLGDELRLGWVHLCAIAGDYNIGWHRDVGPANRDNNYQKEMDLLRIYRKHMVKWHMALVDDPCLWIVPGSQNRYRTEREHQCMLREPQGEIPGALRVDLERGQTIFWDGNTVHSGLKPEGMGDRLSLMGGLIDHRAEYHESEKGDQQWMLAENLRPSLPQSTQIYYDNWRTVAESRMAESVR